jgi:pimeloyl-ACP methyl ester carboxylesterase
MITSHGSDQLYLIGVREQAVTDECTRVTFFTTRRDLTAYTHLTRTSRQAVILLDSDTNDLEAHSEFDQLAREIGRHGIGSIRLDYRFPGDRAQCAIDALLACQYLDDERISDVLLVGWSFGAAVALAAGSVGRIIIGVAAIHPPDLPECCIHWMGRKRLLVMDDNRYSRSELADWILRTLDSARPAREESRQVLAS